MRENDGAERSGVAGGVGMERVRSSERTKLVAQISLKGDATQTL